MTGLIGSAYDFAFILALPIVGLAADMFPATALIALSLALYTLVGLGYLLAGVFGLVILIVIARFTNGITYALDYVGRQTYFRRHVEKNKLASVFGYFDTVADLWWIIAALIGIILIRYFSIPWLLFMITPSSLIALIVIMRLRKTDPEKVHILPKLSLRGSYGAAMKEIQNWSLTMKGLAVFNFFIALAGTVTAFFLPVEAYVQGASFAQVILIGVLFTVPPLLGWFLGKWFDIKGTSVFLYSLILFAVLLGSIAFIDTYAWKLVAALGIGMVLELLALGSGELVTVYALPEHFGRVGGIMESITDLGSLVGPLAVGILIDAKGTSPAFTYLSITVGILAVMFFIVKKFSPHKEIQSSI
jgi:MFS family permease